MTRIGFKTFICSFTLSLSAIFGVDRAFFYAPQSMENKVQIPRKNIALFFRPTKPFSYSLKTELVQQEILKAPSPVPEKSKVVERKMVPQQQPAVKVLSEEIDAEEKEIPLVVEKIPEPDKIAEITNMPDMPLVYAGNYGEKTITEEKTIEKKAVKANDEENNGKQLAETPTETAIALDLAKGPIIIKGTRQVFKIDNSKKHKESQTDKNNEIEKTETSELIVSETKENIPLQGEVKKVEKEEPADNQLANLGEMTSLSDTEEEIAVDVSRKEKQWQTMAEKHKNDNPWLVARGSKFLKNRKF